MDTLLTWLIAALVLGFFVIRYWRAPSSLVPRTRVRYYLAALFALAELAGVGLLIWGLTQIPLRPVAR